MWNSRKLQDEENVELGDEFTYFAHDPAGTWVAVDGDKRTRTRPGRTVAEIRADYRAELLETGLTAEQAEAKVSNYGVRRKIS